MYYEVEMYLYIIYTLFLRKKKAMKKKLTKEHGVIWWLF